MHVLRNITDDTKIEAGQELETLTFAELLVHLSYRWNASKRCKNSSRGLSLMYLKLSHEPRFAKVSEKQVNLSKAVENKSLPTGITQHNRRRWRRAG